MDSELTIRNTILWRDTANRGGNEVYLGNASSVTIISSNVQGGQAGIEGGGIITAYENNLDADPMFVNPDNQDYHLQPISPCINAGNPAAIYNDVDGSRNDMGAYGGPLGDWQQESETVVDETGTPSTDIFEVDVSLSAGVNMISLPLRPKVPISASQLATDLSATWVIRAIDGRFQTYIPEGNFGIDFDIEVSKGYIVNLLSAKTYHAEGEAWGTKKSAAPRVESDGTWAFVVAGRIDDVVRAKVDGIQVTNHRTGEKHLAPISPSGRFTTAFVDTSQQAVIAVGDTITTKLVGTSGVPLTEAKPHIITSTHTNHALLTTHLSALPKRTRLLQNFPNPFNPETWLPYQLASPAEVTIEIIDIRGRLIRRLNLGQQPAGLYLNRENAAYWNGRSETGELVSSGLYFYQLQAGDPAGGGKNPTHYSAVKRLAILK